MIAHAGIVASVLLLTALPLAASNRYAPAVTSIHPPSGLTTGGTPVTIHGTYFQPGATVTIGGVPLVEVVRKSSGEITGTTGARVRGTVNVVVTNPNGASSRLTKAFTYVDGTCCEYPSFSTMPLTGASTQPPPSVAVGAFAGAENSIVLPAFDVISLFEGNGTHTFTPVQTFNSGMNFSATEVLDVNGDSVEDVAMVALGGDVLTLLGDPDYPLSESRLTPSTAFAFALDSGDFNHDGVPDLVIPDHASGSVSICLGSLGGGGCAATNTYAVCMAPSGITTGDFNGDTNLDIAISDDEEGSVTILLGSGTGSFVVGPPIPAGTPATEVMGLSAGYLNGDNILDLAVSTGVILLGYGDGTFIATTPLPLTSGRHVAISDFNRDGKRDIAIDTSLAAVHVMLGDGTGGFVQGPTVQAKGGLYNAFAAFDIEGDGMVDLAIGGSPHVARNVIAMCPTITVNPAALAAGTVGEAYDVTFTQSGGNGVATYKLSGTLPHGLAFGGGTLSGTPLQSGQYAITVTAADANGCSTSRDYSLTINGDCPALVAHATTAGSVHVSWSAVTGATSYQVWRSSLGQAAVHVASSLTTHYDDATEAGKAYVYYVRASIGNTSACASNVDIATTILFEDSLIGPGVTAIKAIHFTQLHAAVNAVRVAAGLAPVSFSTISVGGSVRTSHVHELRSALAGARQVLGLPPINFTDEPLTAETPIRAVHLTELRDGVQ
jgi:hypothetical protein